MKTPLTVKIRENFDAHHKPKSLNGKLKYSCICQGKQVARECEELFLQDLVKQSSRPVLGSRPR